MYVQCLTVSDKLKFKRGIIQMLRSSKKLFKILSVIRLLIVFYKFQFILVVYFMLFFSLLRIRLLF